MSTRPAFTTLRLTAPRRMGDGDGHRALVLAVQHRIRGYGIEQDGIFGARTSLGVAIWQERVGSPNVSGAIGPADLQVLLGYRKVPREWIPLRSDPVRISKAKARQEILAKMAAAERPTAASIEIVPRSEWCPIPRARDLPVVQHGPGVPHVVHWFGPGAAAETRASGISQVIGFTRYHMLTLGWLDLGYNWAILRDGGPGEFCTVLEGRGRNARGAHSGHNTANTYPGVLVLAGDKTPTATESQLRTLQALRTSERWGRRYGHLEFFSTSCPGPVIWPWVQNHR